MKPLFYLSFAIALGAPLMACQNTPEEAQRAALTKQQQANETATKAQGEADAKEREAQRVADRDTAKAQNEASHKSAEAQRTADDTSRVAQAKADKAEKTAMLRASETYDQFTYRAEHDLTDIERRATSLEKGSKGLDASARAKTEVVVNDVKAKGATVRDDVKHAGKQSGIALVNTKTKVNRTLDDLEDEIHDASP